MNAHSLIHIPFFVRQWGPLWTMSAFSFEHMNGFLCNMVHSTRKIGQQLSFSLDVKCSLQALYSSLEKKESVQVLDYLNYTKVRSNMTKLKTGYAIGTISTTMLTVQFS